MSTTKTFSPSEILGAIVRRRWLILLPFAVGLALAPLIATKIPETYRSETVILVIPQRVPDSYVRSTVTSTVGDRLASMSDQIMSRSRLERIITDFDLYPEERAAGAMEDVVRRMRGDIIVTPPFRDQQSFRVAYVSRDAATAQRVTARLASLFIEENLRDRADLAESTNQFLESQLEDAKNRLVEHERKLETYRRQHAGELPSQAESNLQAIQNLSIQRQSLADGMNRARERRLLIERQLADVEMLPVDGGLRSADGDGTAMMPPAQQLQIARANLELVRMRYTADHPDVRRLERSIRELEVKVKEEAANPVDADRPKSLGELTREKRIRDLQAEIDVIDRQLVANQAEQTRVAAEIVRYQGKVDAVPARESELVELTRDYDTLNKAYSSLLAKREESKLAANLERRNIGEQFRILDVASLPQRPDNRWQRLGIIFSGAIAGFALGILAAGLLEYRDSSFRTEEDLVAVLAIPVLAIVPAMASQSERMARRRRTLALDIVATAVLLASVAVVVFWRVRL